MKTAIVTGCTGQDGSYLCEYLLEMGYRVIGIARRSMRENNYLEKCHNNARFQLHIMDINDSSGIRNIVRNAQPHEFYNLAAMSHVGQSFKEPLTTMSTNATAVFGILEGIRHECPDCRMYQASSSEMFGNQVNTMKSEDSSGIIYNYQNELTPMIPRSPYGVAKLAAHNAVRIYREGYNMFSCAGILQNHESIRRGKDFVTRKITHNLVRIKCGLQKTIKLGNLDPCRDFGYAPDYVKAMHLMLQQDKPDDFVIATGRAISVRALLEMACEILDLDPDEVYEPDPQFMRPAEIFYLCGDATKARNVLGWKPQVPVETWLEEMVEYDMRLLEEQEFCV